MDESVAQRRLSLHARYRERVAPAHAEPTSELLIELYTCMLLARRLDQAEADLSARGEAFFHLPCSGHEALAALALLLSPQDWLHLHYRDKALLLALGVPVEQYLHDLVSNDRSHSAGRQMSPFLADPARRVLAQNIPVGNHGLQAVGIAQATRDRAGRPITVCSMGDGATQQGESLEAIAEAVRSAAPVLFLIEDNRYSISTPTRGRTFFSLPPDGRDASEVLGLPIHRCDGRDPVSLLQQLGPLVNQVRQDRVPALAVISVERLANHTNADDERVYRGERERAEARRLGDPITCLENRLAAFKVAPELLAQARAEVELVIARALDEARHRGDPLACHDAKRPLPEHLIDPRSEYRGQPEGTRLTMIEAMRGVLRCRLAGDDRVHLLGQDIEDPKGDVFGVTRGLSTAFPGRVVNAALSESTIVGTAIGRALAGERPVAFVQFADFLPQAFNQIHSELGSMYWRTAGGWECPVIVMVACGGYRPGLGPFHAQTLESLMVHVPGVDVVMPATAADAAGLLNAAFESGRPTIFFYPKTCLNDRDQTTSADVEEQLVPLGQARHVRRGDDLTLVAWGSTVRLAEQTAEALAAAGVSVDLLDLRCLSPWDQTSVCESAARTGRLLVVHEDNRSCGLGGEIVATVAERVSAPVACRRVTRDDTYVPYNFANQIEVLPSFERLLTTAAELTGLDLAWDRTGLVRQKGRELVVEARGSSPADQAVTVVSWSVDVGDKVAIGQTLAELEADKSVFEFGAPSEGQITRLLVAEGQQVPTGSPLLVLETPDEKAIRTRPTREEAGTPKLTRRAPAVIAATAVANRVLVGLSIPVAEVGSLGEDNADIVARFEGRSPEDIVQRTGIASRRRLAPDESIVELAARAARRLMEQEQVSLDEIDGVICSTGSPPGVATPSMACMILHELGRGSSVREIPAFDISAACSGYIYALSVASDRLQSRPDERLLVITAEALSGLANPDDFDTAILFGDAATATLVTGAGVAGTPWARLRRPVLSAKGEPGKILRVPTPGAGYIAMDGLRVYAEAVRQMIAMLKSACQEAGLKPQDLDLVVPHQANARIIADIVRRLGIPTERMYLNLNRLGNTSSSSIPLCLAELASMSSLRKVGLTAFGGGYTFAAAVLDVVGHGD